MSSASMWESRRAEAVSRHHACDLPGAERAYLALLADRPDAADILELLGILKGQQGDPERALELIRRAIALKGEVPRYHLNLATTLLDLNRLEDAAASFRRAHELEPESVPALASLAETLQRAGKHQEALACYDKLLQFDADNAVLQTNRGVSLAELGQLEASLEAHAAAVDVDPEFAEGWCNLGCALGSMARHGEALEAFERALILNPSLVEAQQGNADALRNCGRHEEAIVSYRRLIGMQPNFLPALINLGHALHEIGQFDAAEGYYRKALVLNPANAGVWMALAEQHRFEPDDRDLSQLRVLVKGNDFEPVARSQICFALAKACEDIGEFDEAFELLREGNRLKRASFRYDVFTDEARMADIRRIATRKLVTGLAAGGNASSRPIFIIGMPRSGTTLVEQIISSHPDVHGAGEIGEFQRLVLEELPRYPSGLASLEPQRIARLAARYLQALERLNSSAPRVTDKLPGNFLYTGLLHACFPSATIIHCVRDPRDTAVSCFRKLFAGSQYFAYDLEEIGRYYRAYEGLMMHWREVLPGRVHRFSYEELIAAPQVQIEVLLAHCGLPWSRKCFEFRCNLRPVRTASAVDVRRPLYNSSIGASKRYAEHVRPLLTILGDSGAGVSNKPQARLQNSDT